MLRSKKSKINRIVNVAIIALICYIVGSLFMLQADIASYRKQLAGLETQCAEQEILNQEMAGLLEKGSDFDYIIKMAREKLGLAFPDERIFYNASGNQ